jgi:hypothetical protein
MTLQDMKGQDREGQERTAKNRNGTEKKRTINEEISQGGRWGTWNLEVRGPKVVKCYLRILAINTK